MIIKLDDGAFMPSRAFSQDAGLDVFTPIAFTIKAGGSYTVDTGVHINLPRGSYGRLESKSGLHVKHDIVCLGGTLDEGYLGSVRVKLYNFGEQDYTFEVGDKIVQLVILPVLKPSLQEVDDEEWGKLSSDRGEGGFGSTGR